MASELTCTYCGKEFKKKAKLAEHTLSHTGEKPHICDYEGCGKAFSRAAHLRRHQLTHTGEKPFHCIWEGCSMSFTCSHHLRRHVAAHEEEKPHKCTWEGCNEAFLKTNQLRRHMCTHTGEKPFPCTYEGCTASFSQPSYLRKHIAGVHEKQLLNICGRDECGAAFRTFMELQRHVKEAHPPVHKCSECDKTFANKNSLRDHMKLHQESRPSFVCEHCGKEFSKKSNLMTHIKVVHLKIRIFQCETCGDEFTYNSLLQRHIKRVHVKSGASTPTTPTALSTPAEKKRKAPETQQEYLALSETLSSKKKQKVLDLLLGGNPAELVLPQSYSNNKATTGDFTPLAISVEALAQAAFELEACASPSEGTRIDSERDNRSDCNTEEPARDTLIEAV